MIKIFKKERKITKVSSRRLDLEPRLKVITTFPGDWESIFKGEGEDFSDLREYQFGDDFRKIYWPSVAKTGQYFVRENIALRELRIFLALDFSSSMLFHQKPEMLDNFSALIASLSQRSTIPLGAILFREKSLKFIPARSGKTQLEKVLDEICSFGLEPLRKSDFPSLFDFMIAKVPSRSLVFLVSDFGEKENLKPHLLKGVVTRFDLIPVIIQDELEINLDLGRGQFSFIDLESGREIEVFLDPKRIQEYQEFKKKELHLLKDGFEAHSLDFLIIDSPDLEAMYSSLKLFFRRRIERRISL